MAEYHDAAEERAGGEHDQDGDREAERGDRLGPEQLRAAGGAGQHGLPRAVLESSLAKMSPATIAVSSGSTHWRGEAEDQKGHGVAVVVDVAAEQGVLGRSRLAVTTTTRPTGGVIKHSGRVAARAAAHPACWSPSGCERKRADSGRCRCGAAGAAVERGGAHGSRPSHAAGLHGRAAGGWLSVSMKNRASRGVCVGAEGRSATRPDQVGT